MKILYSTLAETCEVSSWSISVAALLKLTHTYYCGPMTVRGYCTEDCSNCASVLKFAFHHAVKPRNPAALLTYALRNALGAYADNQLAHKPVVPAPVDQEIKAGVQNA